LELPNEDSSLSGPIHNSASAFFPKAQKGENMFLRIFAKEIENQGWDRKFGLPEKYQDPEDQGSFATRIEEIRQIILLNRLKSLPQPKEGNVFLNWLKTPFSSKKVDLANFLLARTVATQITNSTIRFDTMEPIFRTRSSIFKALEIELKVTSDPLSSGGVAERITGYLE
jgi:hypothetical protein